MSHSSDLFAVYRFGVPLSKSYTTTERGGKQYVVEGVASDEAHDQQGEVLVQHGMDFAPFLETGIINWDHKSDPASIIGEPITAEIQPGPKFYVKAHLYVDDIEQAAHAWHLAQAMTKSSRRNLGWSVEGAVSERDRQNQRRILRSEVRHVALTHQPVNSNSWAAIVKSMTTATAAPLQLENLDKHMTDILWGACLPDRQCYTDTGYFHAGRAGMLEHLCKCKGIQVSSAAALMKRLINSGL